MYRYKTRTGSHRPWFALVLCATVLASGCATGETGAPPSTPEDAEAAGETGDAQSEPQTENPDSTAAETVVVGANLELSGVQASLGDDFEKGIELAESLINEDGFEVAGERYELDVQIQDNRSEPQQGVLLQQRFQQDGVKFILGPAASTAYVPALQALEGHEYISLTPAAGAIPFLGTELGRYIYQTHMPEEGERGRDAQIVELVEELYQPDRVAILLAQDPNGELFSRAFTDAFEAHGTDIVYSEFFPADTSDFSSYVTAIRAADPDLIVQGYLNTRVAPFLEQAATAGLGDIPIISAPGGDAGALDGVEDEISDYIWSVATRSVTTSDGNGIDEYRANYEAKYGEQPPEDGFWALTYYDPLLMLVEAMKLAGTVDDVDAIAQALAEVEEWDHAAMPDRRFDGESQFAVYTPQIGLFSDGDISYELAE